MAESAFLLSVGSQITGGRNTPPLAFSKSAIFLPFLLDVGSVCLPLPLCAPCFSLVHTKPALSAELLGCEDRLWGQSPGMPLKCCERARVRACVSQTLVFWPPLTYQKSPRWAPSHDPDAVMIWRVAVLNSDSLFTLQLLEKKNQIKCIYQILMYQVNFLPYCSIFSFYKYFALDR